MKKIIAMTIQRIREMNLFLLLLSPIIIAIVFLTFSGNLCEYVTKEKVSDNSIALMSAISSFIAGFTGIFQMIRKETPGVFSSFLKGLPSVLTGLLCVIMFWGFSIYMMILYVSASVR
jgi:hypothetical protein